jgi:hypothetical protein
MRNLHFAITCAAILVVGPSYAACNKPEAPSCTQQGGAFAGEDDFDKCRMQMLAYRDGMDALATCLQKDGQSAQEQSARDELQTMLARFNRRARGE